jgi:hypothetical protein
MAFLTRVQAKITGTSPVLLHNCQLANPRNWFTKQLKEVSSKRKKTEQDHDLLSQIEWLGGLYTMKPDAVDDNWRRLDKCVEIDPQQGTATAVGKDQHVICIPASTILGGLTSGAKKNKLGRQATAGVFVSDDFPLLVQKGSKVRSITVQEAQSAEEHYDVRSVKVGTARVMRTRPVFDNWSLVFSFDIQPDVISASDVKIALEACGAVCGIGDYRPQFGRFVVDSFEVIK